MKRILFAIICTALLLTMTFSVLAEDAQEISLGAEYSLITPASHAYPDDGIKLTDGVYGTIPEGSDNYYASNAYVGFNKADLDENGNFIIILDLGESKRGLNSFTVGYLNDNSAGISAPMSVSFAISEERNGVYSQLGTLTTKEDYSTAASTFAKALETPQASGRFIKITVTPDKYVENDTEQTVAWTFIDEIAVHAINLGEGSLPDGEESEEDNLQDTPQTGDISFAWAYLLLGASAISMGLALFIKMKKSEQY